MIWSALVSSLTQSRRSTGLQKPEVWEKDFVSTHVKMKGFTEMMSKQAYVKSCQKFRGYGYTFFQAKQSHLGKKEAKTIFLGKHAVLPDTLLAPADLTSARL